MAVHEKSIVVDASPHKVFLIWSNYENFPKFMSHVKNVKILDGDISHWEGKVAGVDEEWDAKTTKKETDKVIAWDSIAGFENSGEIRFEPVEEGTKITVHFEYNPPAGVFGDVAEAVYVGKEFDDSLVEDLKNFKERVEEKKAA